MKLFARAALLVLAGIVIGAAHSYCAPFRLRPDNNPEPADAGATGPGLGTNGVSGTRTTPDAGTSPAGQADGETPKPPPIAAAPPDKPPANPPAASKPNYFIDLDRAKQLFDRGQAQHDVYFVDARPLKDYAALHVTGAMHLPPEAFERPPQKAIDYLPGMTVVVYCHGATCTDSERVMIGLQDLKRDIGPIYIMNDGFDPWKARNWPVEAGPDPLGR